MSRYDEGLIAPKTLTDRETELLLRTTGERRGGFRDHLLFSMALGTALREHELVALNMGDVYDDDGRPRRRVALTVFKRSNEDRTLQQIILNETVRAKLAKYRGWKQRAGESVASDAPVFVSRNRNRLSTRQVRRLMHVWQDRAGVEANLSFHGLRHTACSNLYRGQKCIKAVARFARHKSLRSSDRYTHLSDQELNLAVQRLPC
jgi:integrase/recombinase XerC